MLSRPGVHLHCDVNYDPFVYLHKNNIIYGSFLSCLIDRTPTQVDLNATQGSPSRSANTDVRSSRFGPLSAVCPTPYPRYADLRFMAHSPLPTDFISENPKYIVWKNAMGFLSDNGGADYNLCHCASFLPSPARSGF